MKEGRKDIYEERQEGRRVGRRVGRKEGTQHMKGGRKEGKT